MQSDARDEAVRAFWAWFARSRTVVLLDALLGEGRRLLHIREVESVIALKAEEEDKATDIASLPQHLDSLW